MSDALNYLRNTRPDAVLSYFKFMKEGCPSNGITSIRIF